MRGLQQTKLGAVTVRHAVPALAAIVMMTCTTTGVAQGPSLEELQNKLRERDKVIMELLERVEALERRIGISGSPDAAEQQDAEKQNAAGLDGETSRRAPGEVVVSEAAAERALERSLTQAGALLLRPGQIEVEPRVSYARNEDAVPTFVTDGDRTLAAQLERDVDSLRADLSVRLGLPGDSQLEVGVPYQWRNAEHVTNIGFSPVDTSEQTGAGIGDLRIGVAKTLLHEGPWRPDLVGRITWDTATGEGSDEDVSLGGGFNELRTSLTAITRQDPVAFVGGLSFEHTFESRNIQPGASVSGSVGGYIALSPQTSLRLLLAAGRQQETKVFGSTVDGSDQTTGSFVVGSSTLLAPGALLDLSAGIGLTDDADDFSFTLSIPIRFDSSVLRAGH